MKKSRILVVDDEDGLCEILKFNLEVEGFEVDTASSAEDALRLDISKYDLLLLDVMMGEMSGFKMAHILKLKPETAHIPIIFCTAKDSENDTVAGLNIGADDYITKPFSVREVMARVKTVLRRTKQNEQSAETQTLQYKGLAVDSKQKICTVDGKVVLLAKKELELLSLLLANRNTIFSRDEIMHRIWSDEVIVLDRSVDVTVTRLRKKIEPYGEHIVTRHGYGYGFEA